MIKDYKDYIYYLIMFILIIYMEGIRKWWWNFFKGMLILVWLNVILGIKGLIILYVFFFGINGKIIIFLLLLVGFFLVVFILFVI